MPSFPSNERRPFFTFPKPVDRTQYHWSLYEPSLEPLSTRKIKQHHSGDNRKHALARKHQHQYAGHYEKKSKRVFAPRSSALATGCESAKSFRGCEARA